MDKSKVALIGRARKAKCEIWESITTENAGDFLRSLSALFVDPMQEIVQGAADLLEWLFEDYDLMDYYYINLDSVHDGEQPDAWRDRQPSSSEQSTSPSVDPDEEKVRIALLHEISGNDIKFMLANHVLDAIWAMKDDDLSWQLSNMLDTLFESLHFEDDVAEGLRQRVAQLVLVITDKELATALSASVTSIDRSPMASCPFDIGR